MKRYNIIGESTFDFIKAIDGDVIFHDDFINFILARIKELEAEIENEDSSYSVAFCRVRIDELKRLLN